MFDGPESCKHGQRCLRGGGNSGIRRGHVGRPLLVELGPRPCELASLTWKALVDAGGALTGRMVWKSRKGGDVRDEPLSGRTLAAIADLHKAFRIESINRAIFTTQRNGPFKDQSMRSHIISLGKTVGLAVSAYSVRHMVFDTEARAVLDHGGNGRTLTAFTGHKSLFSVQHYLDRHDAVRAEVSNSRHERMATV